MSREMCPLNFLDERPISRSEQAPFSDVVADFVLAVDAQQEDVRIDTSCVISCHFLLSSPICSPRISNVFLFQLPLIHLWGWERPHPSALHFWLGDWSGSRTCPIFFTSDSLVLGILWKLWGCCHFLPFVAICCLSVVFKTSNGGKPIDLAVWAMIREISRDWRKTLGCTFLYQRANLGRCFSCTQSIFFFWCASYSFHLRNFTRLSLQLHRSFHGCCTRDNQRRCQFSLCPGKIPVLHDPLLSVPVVHNGSLRVVWAPGRARLLNARPFVQPMAQCQGVRMCWASLT